MYVHNRTESANLQSSSYWIVKGNKQNIQVDDRDGDIVKQMKDYLDGTDRSPNSWVQQGKPIEPAFRTGNVVLAWRSRRYIGIVGIGEVQEVEEFEDGVQFFTWEPVQCFDDSYISIDEIKSVIQSLKDTRDKRPHFTQPGIIKTVYAVNLKQASCLKDLILRRVSLNKRARGLLERLEPSRVMSTHQSVR